MCRLNISGHYIRCRQLDGISQQTLCKVFELPKFAEDGQKVRFTSILKMNASIFEKFSLTNVSSSWKIFQLLSTSCIQTYMKHFEPQFFIVDCFRLVNGWHLDDFQNFDSSLMNFSAYFSEFLMLPDGIYNYSLLFGFCFVWKTIQNTTT